MKIKAISFYLSLFCFPISILAFINILYSSYFDYFLNVDSYTITLILSLLIGVALFYFGKKSIKKLEFLDQLILVLFTYILISVFISIPYYLSIYQIPLINALFESFSGLTVTGFSTFTNIKYLDPTLILWRSSSQWLGGMYFLIFLILIFSNTQLFICSCVGVYLSVCAESKPWWSCLFTHTHTPPSPPSSHLSLTQ